MPLVYKPAGAKGDPGGYGDYGSFYDTGSQAGGSIKAFHLDTTVFSKNITIANNTGGDPTRITFGNLGKFNLAFSAQLTKSGGSGADVYVWLRHQEVDVPDSATVLHMSNNLTRLVAAWNFFLDVNTKPQYFELMWYTTDTNISVTSITDATTPAGVPSVPSVILTVNQVG